MTVRIRGTDIQYPDGSLQSSYTVTGPTGPSAAIGATGPTGVGTNYSNANVAGYLSGSVTVGNITAGGTIAMASSFKRNRIINGNMSIWQRATSSTPMGFNPATYLTVDRWYFQSTITSLTSSQSTSAPSGFQYSTKVQRTAGATSTYALIMGQIIESVNCFDLSGQTVTLSFWAKAGANYSAASNNLSAKIYTGTAADQGSAYLFPNASWTGGATPLNSTVSLTTTWTKYTATAVLGSGVLEAAVFFSFTPTGTAGADDAVYITGVQLESGSIDTPYEFVTYSEQLAQCQRYYEVVGGSAFVNYTVSGVPTIAMYCYKTQKRATPTDYGFISGNFNTMTVSYGGVSYVDLGYSGSTLGAGVTFVGTGFVSAEL